eukprot:11545-Heterococcus_DN1.PRE.1
MLYVPSFMNILLDKAAAHSKLHPERLPAETFAGIKTFSEFNEKVLLPLYGFDSVDAYYDVVDAKRHLAQIRVPVVVINARDDPLIAEASLPTTDEVSTITLVHEHLVCVFSTLACVMHVFNDVAVTDGTYASVLAAYCARSVATEAGVIDE